MPATSAALVLEQPRRLVARELALPEIGDDDALLRVEACGLCGTDHELFTGELFPGYAFVPGHETVGVIEQIGGAAAKRWNVREGTRVAVEVYQSCRECAGCRSGDTRRCEWHGLADMYGFSPVERPPGLWGGYAQYQYLAPDSQVFPVDGSLDPVVATLFNPIGAGIRWAVGVPATKRGDVIAVLGPGVRGLSAAAAAKDAGARFVMVTGVGPRDDDRLAAAHDFGADLTVDVSVDDPVRALRTATGELADVVVDVTAKAPAALAQAVELARPGATVVLAGTRGSPDTPGFSPDAIVLKELRLLGALGVDTDSSRAALGLLASGRYPFADLTRRVAPFDEVSALLTDMAGEGNPPPVHGVVVPPEVS